MKDSFLPKIIIAVIGGVILLSMLGQCSQQAQVYEQQEMMQNMYMQQMQDTQNQNQYMQQQLQQQTQQQQMEMQQMMQQFNGGYPMQPGMMPPNGGYPPNGYLRSGEGYVDPSQ